MTKVDIEKGETAEGVTHVITSMENYDGNSVEEKIDSLIAKHAVVMISKSWCLFCHE
jgi:hypothetical protein